MSEETSVSEETASAQMHEKAVEETPEQVQPHLGNIAFWVSDFDGMRRFYSEIIGVPEIASGDPPYQFVFYAYGPFSFSLNKADFTPEPKGWRRCPMPPSHGENWEPYFTLYVPDLQAVIARCKEAGIALRSEEPFSLGDGFGFSIDIMDPDGNAVAVTQRPS